MSAAVTLKPSSLPGKVFWMVRNRPAHVWRNARAILLFKWAALMRRVFRMPGVELGSGVRIQKNACVMAEAPSARISIGDGSVVYEKAKVEAYQDGQITIGPQSILGDILIFSRKRITIGKRFLSSWNVFITDYDQHPTDADLRGLQVASMCGDAAATAEWKAKGWKFPADEVVIGDDVWVGANVTILKGARIGDGCVVATGAVVLRGEYPPHSAIAGNPAKVVKTLK